MKRAGEPIDDEEDRDRRRPRVETDERLFLAAFPELEWEFVKTISLLDYLELVKSLLARQEKRDEIQLKFYHRDFANYFQPDKELDFARRLRIMYGEKAKNKLELYTLAGFLMRTIMMIIQSGLRGSCEFIGLSAVNGKPDQAWIDAIEQSPYRRTYRESLVKSEGHAYVAYMCARHLYEPYRPPTGPRISWTLVSIGLQETKGPKLCPIPPEFEIHLRLFRDPSQLRILAPLPASTFSLHTGWDESARSGWFQGLPSTTFVDKLTGVPVFSGQVTMRLESSNGQTWTPRLDISICFINVDYFTDIFAATDSDDLPTKYVYMNDREMPMPPRMSTASMRLSTPLADFVTYFFFRRFATKMKIMVPGVPVDDADVGERWPLEDLMREITRMVPRPSATGDKTQPPLIYFEDKAGMQ